MNKTTLYLPEELQRQLRDAAKRSGRPQADLVRESLERYLSAEEVPAPSSIGSGKDDDLDGRDTEDWLRSRWQER